MKTRKILVWFVTAMMLLTSFALLAPSGLAEEEGASSSEEQDASELINGEGSELSDGEGSGSVDCDELESDGGEQAEPVDNEETKQIISEASETMEKAIYSGQHGPKLYWSYNEGTATLTITGSGRRYADSVVPWIAVDGTGGNDYHFIQFDMRKAILEKGNTIIEYDSFYDCGNLRIVTIPSSVTTIQWDAFDGCTSLTDVYYTGTIKQREKMTIEEDGNDALLNATWHYESEAELVITQQPKSVKVNMCEQAFFTVEVSGVVLEDYPIDFNWFYQKPGEKTWEFLNNEPEMDRLMEGYNLGWDEANHTQRIMLHVYEAWPKWDGYAFRCMLTGPTKTIYSKKAKLTVKYDKLSIKTQPKTVKIHAGQTAVFQVTATGAKGYQWYTRSNAKADWVLIEGATSSSYSLTATFALDGSQYRCIVKGYTESKASKEATLNLIPRPSITSNPKGCTVDAGKKVKLKVSAKGENMEYQWDSCAPGASAWEAVPGATKAEYSFVATAAEDMYQYRCRVKNGSGEVYSGAATVHVRILVEELRAAPGEESLSLEAGEQTTVHVMVLPENAADKTLTYSSSNKRVATVDSNGTVEAKSVGKCKITVKSSNGKKLEVPVEVTGIPVLSLTTAEKRIFLYTKEVRTASISVYPANATDQKLSFSSSNKNVASVNEKGKISAVKPGKCTISATSHNGKTVTIQVIVENSTGTNYRPNKGIIETFEHPITYDQFNLLQNGSVSVERDKDQKTWYYWFTMQDDRLKVKASAFFANSRNDYSDLDEALTNGIKDTAARVSYVFVTNDKESNQVDVATMDSAGFEPPSVATMTRHSFELTVLFLDASRQGIDITLKCIKGDSIGLTFTDMVISSETSGGNFGKYVELVTPDEYYRALSRGRVWTTTVTPSFAVTVSQPGSKQVRLGLFQYQTLATGYTQSTKKQVFQLIDVGFTTAQLVGELSTGALSLKTLYQFIKLLDNSFDENSTFELGWREPLSTNDNYVLYSLFKSPAQLRESEDGFQVLVNLKENDNPPTATIPPIILVNFSAE